MPFHRRVLPFLALAAAAPVVPLHADEAAMFRYPDVSGDRIVFVFANDLWTVPLEGGEAKPLASPPGTELMPRFSPDGSQIAFVGNYDGNRDLYRLDADGGVPVRVTHHPTTELLSEWTADGDLLFTAGGMGGVPRAQRIFRVPSEGGLPQALPVPYGTNGTLSADGRWLAYTPHSIDRRTWKRYRGGMATDVWLLDLASGESRRITDWEGKDTLPMWHGRTVYYLSDEGAAENHRLNLWAYDLDRGERRQVTAFRDHDVKWPAIGPDDGTPARIVFQNGSDIYLWEEATGLASPVEIAVPGDRDTLRPRIVDASQQIQSWDLGPKGRRAAVSARGDLWTLPAEKGTPRNLTRTSGVAERVPAWSPDGRWIAVSSDESGEYEVRLLAADGRGGSRTLTSSGGPYRMGFSWSPDSTRLVVTDKDGTLRLIEIESGEIRELDRNPWSATTRIRWSHDGRWIACAMAPPGSRMSRIVLHDLERNERHEVTSGMFNDFDPVFDRAGDWLYFASQRHFSPTYSDLDTTWIYRDGTVLLAVPLREGVKNPWLAESDEVAIAEGEDQKGEPDETDGAGKPDEANGSDATDQSPPPAAADGAGDGGDGGDGGASDAAVEVSPASGHWACTATDEEGVAFEFAMDLGVGSDGRVRGSLSPPGTDRVATVSGSFDPESGRLVLSVIYPEAETGTLDGVIEGDAIRGRGSDAAGAAYEFTGNRLEKAGTAVAAMDPPAKGLAIDLDGFERRAIALPVPPGDLGNLEVNDQGQLLFVRQGEGGGIRLFDPADSKGGEKGVAAGGGFLISPEGSRILVPQGGSASIFPAAANASGTRVVTEPMLVEIDPRAEWRQIVRDAWRMQRDFFYDPTMHGVDWPAVLSQYLPLVDDAATREDVSFIIGEMISELNVGHAYYWGGDGEEEPSVSVGMLGVDFERTLDGEGHEGYRIARLLGGADWDADARNPLAAPGVDAKAGDFLLAVNGVPLDLAKSPWAAFTGLAGKTVTLSLSDRAVPGDDTREVVVQLLPSESNLRYRDWIEGNRRRVAEASDGQVGYIYVPNTGIDGQNDLVRQFHGQAHLPGLVIDERWNGGGQIPTRFIELLNRPVTNYWARRDGEDWTWPPDGHRGARAMLINGLAGSGGDMFPWLFRKAGLGPLIGTRTWGGLVGITGVPSLIDGGYTAVPTFAFYETDGSWGIAGPGVAPDLEVIAAPALILEGGDPQLDRAIAEVLKALREQPPAKPARPAYPDRSGMGIPPEDR